MTIVEGPSEVVEMLCVELNVLLPWEGCVASVDVFVLLPFVVCSRESS